MKNKKTFFVISGLILVAVFFSAYAGMRLFSIMTSTDKSLKPNLVLITVDTLRADHLSVYGYFRDTTPHLSEMAKDGFVFEQAYTPTTNTAPSHATIMTGLYPFQHGLIDNGLKLPDKITTLAELLKQDDYSTAAYVGYWVFEKESNMQQGFDEYELDHVASHAHEKKSLETDTRGFKAAMRWLKRWHGGNGSKESVGGRAPFFLWFHANQTHESYDPPPPYDSIFMNIPKKKGIPGLKTFFVRCSKEIRSAMRKDLLTKPLIKQIGALYDGEIRLVDDLIGQMVAYLKKIGEYENTVIVVTADHGEILFGRYEGGRKHRIIGHTRRYFDPVLRVPIVIKPAENAELPVGARIRGMISTVDLFPTILKLTGHNVPPWAAGKSLVPLMRNPENADGRKKIFIQDVPYEDNCAGERTDRWKFIRCREEGEPARKWLYDLKNDPGEKTNLISTNKKMSETLEREVDLWIKDKERTTPSSYEDMSKKMREALIEGGYIRE